MRMTLFKQPKPRGFNFKPRYYDAEKEAFQARKAEIERQVELEQKGSSDLEGSREYRMRSAFQANGVSKLREKKNKQSNIRVALFAGIIAAFFYFWLYSDLENLF